MATKNLEQQCLDRTPPSSIRNHTQRMHYKYLERCEEPSCATACDEDVCNNTIRDTFRETPMLGCEQNTFAQGLRDLAQAILCSLSYLQ